MNETFLRVEEHLLPWARRTAITPDTELYRDLGIYGDDLAFDVVLLATREFGIKGNLPRAAVAGRPTAQRVCPSVGNARSVPALTLRANKRLGRPRHVRITPGRDRWGGHLGSAASCQKRSFSSRLPAGPGYNDCRPH
jgi:hypothetical protein